MPSSLLTAMSDNLVSAMSKEPSYLAVSNGNESHCRQPLPHPPPLQATITSDITKAETVLPVVPSSSSKRRKRLPFTAEKAFTAEKEKEKKRRVRRRKQADNIGVDGWGTVSTDVCRKPPDSSEEPHSMLLQRRRSSPKDGNDNTKKSLPRKRDRQPMGKSIAKDVQHPLVFPPPDSGRHGILGIYGLPTKNLDIRCHVKDIALESLLSGDFEANQIVCKKPEVSRATLERSSLMKDVNSILQLLAKPSNTHLSQSRLGMDSRGENDKLALELDSTSLADHGSSRQEDESLDVLAVEKPLPTFCSSAKPEIHVHPMKFLDTLQLTPAPSLESLLAQVTDKNVDTLPRVQESADSSERVVPRLPPFLFPTNCITDTSTDKTAGQRLNIWFRAHVSEHKLAGMKFFVGSEMLQDNTVNLNPDCERGLSKHKECLIDIDLNKQLPEVEAESSEVGQIIKIKSESEIPMDERISQVEEFCNTLKIVHDHVTNVDSIMGEMETLVEKEMDIEPYKCPVVRMRPKLPNFCEDTTCEELSMETPYSPCVQATAWLLCRMANSSSSYYMEHDDGEKAQIAQSSSNTKWHHTKAVRISDPKLETRHEDMLAKLNLGDARTDQHQELMHASTSDSRTISVANNSEPWIAMLPQRGISRTFCHPSSEFDWRPNHQPGDLEVHGKNKKFVIAQLRAPPTPGKLPKEGRKKLIIMSKATHLSRNGSTQMIGHKRGTIDEIKHVGYREGLPKLSRPRSASKGSVQSIQNTASGIPVKRRTAIGYSDKALTRQFGTTIGELRQVAK